MWCHPKPPPPLIGRLPTTVTREAPRYPIPKNIRNEFTPHAFSSCVDDTISTRLIECRGVQGPAQVGPVPDPARVVRGWGCWRPLACRPRSGHHHRHEVFSSTPWGGQKNRFELTRNCGPKKIFFNSKCGEENRSFPNFCLMACTSSWDPPLLLSGDLNQIGGGQMTFEAF